MGGNRAVRCHDRGRGVALSVSRSACSIKPDVEGQEAVEQGDLAIEVPSFKAVWIDFVNPMFEESKPAKGAEDLSLHRVGTRVPSRVQHAIDGDCAQTGKPLTRLPVVRGNRQAPEDNAGIALRPSLMEASTQIGKVKMPERGMEQDSLQRQTVRFLQHLSSCRRDFELAPVSAEDLAGLNNATNKEEG